MVKQLNPQDGAAINLLLDKAGQQSSYPGTDAMQYSEPNEAVARRMSSAEKVLNLLSLMPAEEPPADLVERTLSRINTTPMNGISPAEMPTDPLGPFA